MDNKKNEEITGEELAKLNKQVYSELAPEYNEKWKIILPHQKEVLQPFIDRLKKEFSQQSRKNITVVDVGCGVGLDLYILFHHDFEVFGIDLCPKMVSYAKKNVPLAKVNETDFINYNLQNKFHGVVMDAFIHLFPKKEIYLILEKLKNLLLPKGYALITTTQSTESKEGYFYKTDYHKKIKRFRKFWTKEELIQTLNENNFVVIDFYTDYQPNADKYWMNFIVQEKQH